MMCQDYQEWISQYVDYELEERESELLFKHLGGCAECRQFLRSTLQLRSEIRDDILREGQSPAAIWNATTRLSKSILSRRRISLSQVLRLGAILVVVAVMAFVIGRMSRTVETSGGLESQKTIYVAKLPAIEVRAY